MKRTLSLMLALVMVLSTFTVFADNHVSDAEMEAGAFLKANEVLVGDAEGDLLLGNVLKKQNAVVLLSRLMKVEELAKAFPTDEDTTYPDVTDPFYKGYIAWATTEGLIEGKGTGDFGFDDSVTAREFATMLLRSLGYTVGMDADVEWDNALEKAIELGVAAEETEDGIVSRGTVALMVFNALPLNLKDSEETLAEKLEIEMPAPAALEVESVVADNLKEVKVTFNQKVNEETVNDSNVSVDGEKGSAALQDDEMTVVITMDKVLENQEEYTLEVDKVESEDGLMLEDYEEEFTAFDRSLPEALDVKVTGPKNLTITFSEPMETKGEVTIKQNKVNLGSSVDLSGNKADVRVYSNLKDGEEYTVKVEKFEDYAGYKNVVNTLTFTYEEDDTPPVATVEKAEQTYVIVSFDKPVKGLAKDKFYHTFTAWDAERIEDMDGNEIKSTSTSVNKVKVYFYYDDEGNAIPAGETVFGIQGKEIKDNWGNALGTQEYTINTTSDRTKPEVKEIKVKAEDKLEITFTKDVKFARKNIDVLDSDGDKMSGVYLTVEGSGDKYTVDLGKKLSGKTITVSIKNVKDITLYENTLDLYTETLTVTDKTAPKVDKVYYSKTTTDGTGDDKVWMKDLYVVFDEAVDSATALVDENYSLVYDDEVTILEDAELSFDVMNSRVKIELTSDQAKELDGKETTAKLLAINVEDLAGNTIRPLQKGLTDLDETNEVSYTVTATAKDTLEVEFNDVLGDVDMDDFDVDGLGYGDGFSLEQNDGATKTTLVFELDKDRFNTDAKGISFKIDPNHEIENSFGEEANFVTDGTVKDEIKPEVKEDNDDDYIVKMYEDGMITIKFTEAMNERTFSTRSFDVEGKTVTSIDWNGSDELVLNLNEAFDRERARVSYDQTVEDVAGNSLDLDKGVFVEVNDFSDDVVVPAPDKDALQAKIDEANALESEDYTAETWADLQAAIVLAEAVVDDEDATQDDVDAQVVALQEAIDDLEEVVVEDNELVGTFIDGLFGKYVEFEMPEGETEIDSATLNGNALDADNFDYGVDEGKGKVNVDSEDYEIKVVIGGVEYTVK